MEPKDGIDRHPLATTLLSGAREEIKQLSALDSITLVSLCAADPNNIAAWEEFSSRFVSKIRVFVARLIYSLWGRSSSGASGNSGTCPPDQEDLVQEVLMRLVANDCQQLKRFEWKAEDSFLRYLWVVSSSVVTDHYRYLRSQRRDESGGRLEQKGLAVLDRIGLNRGDLKIEKTVLMKEISQVVEDLLREDIANAATRERYLLIFKLHILEGFSLTQVSQCCGINISKQAVDKVIAKITARLKERLGAKRGRV